MATEVAAAEEDAMGAAVASVAHRQVLPADALAMEVAGREMVAVDLEMVATDWAVAEMEVEAEV